ncbi:metallophosphoesterase [Telmatospirillum sp.]|uniref:metallophosphoesterase n=1 Tax=Telmatospirillum sp. TaxID=2079197 RepID=UPI00284CAA9F|nr:metallophosphoesterase [Telmatospirillum sp.]MDR3436469.1 metallophosphoesterase [Telmatospirillum sp.]
MSNTLDIKGTKVAFLGDVHIGRPWKVGVPLHRRGDREQMIKDQFVRELDVECDVLIQVGDLLNRHRVDLNDVVFVADAITKAAMAHADRKMIFMAGNHDLARDVEKISSFELVERLCNGFPNVDFISKAPEHYAPLVRDPRILFVPWSPTKSAAELVAEAGTDKVDLVVGHWDHVNLHGDSNLIPLDFLSKITKLVVSGHDHVAREYQYGDMRVVITGSMSPYSHGEDPNGTMYLTMSLLELENIRPEIIKDKCVRVLLGPGESLPIDIDCLQLTQKRLGADEDDLVVEFEDGLNLGALFAEAMADIDTVIAAKVREKFEDARIC